MKIIKIAPLSNQNTNNCPTQFLIGTNAALENTWSQTKTRAPNSNPDIVKCIYTVEGKIDTNNGQV